MITLIPLKVKIGLTPKGAAAYPDFNQLPLLVKLGIDWSLYVDAEGDGWHYDKLCGHKEEDETSPQGQQWGVLLVPLQFAEEAEFMFPSLVEIMSEADFIYFYDNRTQCHAQEEEIDSEIVASITKKQELGLALTAQQLKAIDPATSERGIRPNTNRFWAAYKAKRGIELGQSA